MDKIQWKKEWQLTSKEYRNYYQNVLHRDCIVELIEDNETKTQVIIPKDSLYIKFRYSWFYELCLLESIHIIPNRLFEIEMLGKESHDRMKINVKKISENEYSFTSKCDKYQAKEEVLSKKELKNKFSSSGIEDVFKPYPFLLLSFGNFFEES